MENPYNVLGVYEGDSLATIKEVYRKLAQTYHPDKFGTSNEISRKQKTNRMASKKQRVQNKGCQVYTIDKMIIKGFKEKLF